MARKNLLTGLTEKKTPNGPAEEVAAPRSPSAAFSGRGAFGAVTRTIDDLAARADAARALEARLTAAEMVVELDPALVDSSFIADRMETDDESYRALRASISAKGQDSPILVRPHPTAPGRYQVAFGHRRLRAAADLGRSVRCIVKPLNDRDLVIAQGQENSARADLSFIERGRFAQALEEGGYDRETIMQALTIDKTTLSRLITVVNRLPTDIVEAVGPAPAAGRDRWVELAAIYAERAVERPVDPLLESAEFMGAPSDMRFEMLFEHLSRVEARPPQPVRDVGSVPGPGRPPRVVNKPRP
jgi:ParB family chromosome partitioning protein